MDFINTFVDNSTDIARLVLHAKLYKILERATEQQINIGSHAGRECIIQQLLDGDIEDD